MLESLHRVVIATPDDAEFEAASSACSRIAPEIDFERVMSAAVVGPLLEAAPADLVVLSAGSWSEEPRELPAWSLQLPVVVRLSAATVERGVALGMNAYLWIPGPDETTWDRLPQICAAATEWFDRKVEGLHPRLPVEVLEGVRQRLSRLKHDLNNPLAIVTGNAQLLIEIARALELDSDLLQPMKDIEEAGGRASILAGQIGDLSSHVAQLIEYAGNGAKT